MEKRLAIALVLCLAWIIIANNFMRTPEAPPTAPEPQPAQKELEESGVGEGGGGESQTAGMTGETETQGNYPQTESLEKESFDVDSDTYHARFTSLGAGLELLQFKQYYNKPEVRGDPQAMADPENWLKILYLIQEDTPSFTLREVASPPRYRLDEVVWEHAVTPLDGGGRRVEFVYKTKDGLVFKKSFTLREGAYDMEVDLSVTNRNPDLKEDVSLILDGPCGIADTKRAAFTTGPMGVLYTLDEERGGRDFAIKKLAPNSLEKAPYSWSSGPNRSLVFAGVSSNYFALLMEPKEGAWIRQVRFHPLVESEKVLPQIEQYEALHGAPPSPEQVAEFRKKAEQNVRTSFLLALGAPAPDQEPVQSFRFFAGPKSTDLMEQPAYRPFYALIESDYGSTMKWINIALIWILRLFHSILGNWGLAIIFLTFVVKGLLFPLNRMQQVSMHSYSEKMKKLKPKLDEIRKKYKNNKKKFNEAQMRIMKEEGVRPPMGCLLVVLQFPIFIGLFQVLRTSFELRHSPFFLWINDLSQPDALMPLPFTVPLLGWTTLNVLPILMTVAFYFQQKMMPQPTTGDPQSEQMQKMMRFMPIFFGFLLYNYAAGLSLYWMTSNLISIFEYKVIRKRFPVVPAQQPAA